MQRIEPARLKPGVTLDELPRAAATNADMGTRVLRGKALIFWDPDRPGKKRDAIDTDQITPSDDCVSESLERLEPPLRQRPRARPLHARVDVSLPVLVERQRAARGQGRPDDEVEHARVVRRAVKPDVITHERRHEDHEDDP